LLQYYGIWEGETSCCCDTMTFGPELGTVVEEVPDTQFNQTSQEVCTVPPKECSESNIAGSGHTQETDSGPMLRRSTHYYNPTDHFGLCVCEVCNLGGRSVITDYCFVYFLYACVFSVM